jgi:hypothetical protein
MNVASYAEQAPWALAIVGACATLLVVGSAAGIVVIARMTTCTAIDAANALATVLAALRRKTPRAAEEEQGARHAIDASSPAESHSEAAK